MNQPTNSSHKGANLARAARKAQKQTRQVARDKDKMNIPAVAKLCTERNEEKSMSVCGPYANRGKWRLVLIDASGRKSMVFSSLEEAENIKANLLNEIHAQQSKTIGESLDEYFNYRIKFRGVKPDSASREHRYLQTLLPLDLPVASLSAEKARRLYLDYTERPNLRNGKPLSPNTHQWLLLVAKCWGKWLIKASISIRNPFANVEPIGKCNVGKPQLRIDEAQRFNRLLIERAQSGNKAAVGVLLMLHLGLRQGEVSARVVRDVDAEGRILVIPFGKTEGSRRRLRVPEWLRPLLVSLTVGKAPRDLLFSEGQRIRRPGYWWRKVREWCEKANVPAVCPHSLRGLHATLAIEEGATSDAVARALGHTTFAMTARHYASADSVANARVARASTLLAPQDRSEEGIAHPAITELLSTLTPAQLAALRNRLAADPNFCRTMQ